MQRIGHVPGGVVPLRKVQGRVDPAGELAQAARRQQVGAAHRIGPEWSAQTGDGGVRRDLPRPGAERVRLPRHEVVRPAELEAERQRVFVSLADRGVEVVARQHDVAAALARVHTQPGDGDLGVGLGQDAAVPLPAAVRL